jgi:uncharacterized protein
VTEYADSAKCGPFELVAQSDRSMVENADGSLQLTAEHTYLVKVQDGTNRDVLSPALTFPKNGSEGRLRFENYVGISELGGRRLVVHSKRLGNTPAAALGATETMLDEVCTWLSSLPFSAGTPTSAKYTRVRAAGPEVLYHVFAILRDAMRDRGPHRLRESTERVLARPYESLVAGEPRLVPLGAASRIDAETLDAIQSAPELLAPVAQGSPLAKSPLAVALRGNLPEQIRMRPLEHTTGNRENRFVAGVLDLMIAYLRRFERQVRLSDKPSAPANLKESSEIAEYLLRCRRHRVLSRVKPLFEPPAHSTVFRSRPGYRQLLALHRDLLLRTTAGDDVARLLESRDAAQIYEMWCYVQVVAALTNELGEPLRCDPFPVPAMAASVGNGYRTEWADVSVSYNESFTTAGRTEFEKGSNSYSLRMRPDITIHSHGRLNLLDAKLKRDFTAAVVQGEEDSKGTDTFKPGDLHKMHAYRDALGADSVWILYPGHGEMHDSYPAPGPEHAVGKFQGVGAQPLRPGAGHQQLQELLSGLL